MTKTTPATRALNEAAVEYTVHAYNYEANARRIGLQAAEALGVSPDELLKTLMAKVDGRPVCALIRSDRELSMKKLAKALSGKKADMMTPDEAERSSGYRVGGISPFGQRRALPVVVDQSAIEHDFVYINGGSRGFQIRINPVSAQTYLNAVWADLVL